MPRKKKDAQAKPLDITDDVDAIENEEVEEMKDGSENDALETAEPEKQDEDVTAASESDEEANKPPAKRRGRKPKGKAQVDDKLRDDTSLDLRMFVRDPASATAEVRASSVDSIAGLANIICSQLESMRLSIERQSGERQSGEARMSEMPLTDNASMVNAARSTFATRVAMGLSFLALILSLISLSFSQTARQAMLTGKLESTRTVAEPLESVSVLGHGNTVATKNTHGVRKPK